jgi:phenylalanyl-tRNA synthetase beta chain
MGRAYIKKSRTDAELAVENYRIAGAYCDDETNETFYSAKNAVADMFDQLTLKRARIVPASKNIPPFAHPARTAEVLINGNSAGFIFGLHPQVKNNFGIEASVSLFDISLDAMFEGAKKKVLFSELQKFPDVPFELSVICGKTVYASDIADVIRNTDKKLIKNISVITVYEGSPIPEGSKSVSFEIVLGADDKTLSSQEIEKLQNGIMDAVKKKGYSIR